MHAFVRIRANHPYAFGLVNNAGFVIIQLDGKFGLYKNIQTSPEIHFSSFTNGVQEHVMLEDITPPPNGVQEHVMLEDITPPPPPPPPPPTHTHTHNLNLYSNLETSRLFITFSSW